MEDYTKITGHLLPRSSESSTFTDVFSFCRAACVVTHTYHIKSMNNYYDRKGNLVPRHTSSFSIAREGAEGDEFKLTPKHK